MTEREEAELPAPLRAAAQRLREAEPVSERWREELLRAVAASSEPRGHGGRVGAWRVWATPWLAFAAGIACAIVGARAYDYVIRDRAERDAAAIATSVERVRFVLVAPSAGRVSIVGDFNGWNPAAQPLRRSADGRTWEVEVVLAPGRYAYAFMVDGALARDPAAAQAKDDDFGTPNSIVMVRGS